MTKLIQNVAELLTPAVPQPAIETADTAPIAVTQLTRDEMELLFSRELGRGRFN